MLKLTPLQREVLIGILLGDASLQTENNGQTYRLRVSQSDKHKDYLFHLYEIFKDFTKTEPIEYVFSDSRNPNKKYKRWSFSTTQQGCFRFFGHQFYKNRQKKIPSSRLLARLLKPRAIAYWYMDDGAQKWKGKSQGVRFCTDNFSFQEVKILSTFLSTHYELKTSFQKQRKNHRIYISSDSFKELKSLIFNFLHPSMHYKFPEDAKKQTQI